MTLSLLRPALFLGASNLTLVVSIQHYLTLDWSLILAMVSLVATATVTQRSPQNDRLSPFALLGLCALMVWPFLGMGALIAHMEPHKVGTTPLLTVLAALPVLPTLAVALVLGWLQARGLSWLVGCGAPSGVHSGARATPSTGMG